MARLLAEERLVTHNYIVVESVAVARRKFEPAAARDLLELLIPLMEVVWVDEHTHAAAVSAFLGAVRRRTSLVDWVSFEVMRQRRISTAFAFDRDFRAQGFELVP
jgi:predicted nucleic acid-binding protein